MRHKNVGGCRLLKNALPLLAVAMISSCAKQEGAVRGAVEGQVFAVLVTGESLKLAGVAIGVHQKDKVDSIVASREVEVMQKTESLRASLKKLEDAKLGLQRQAEASRKAANAQIPPAAIIREHPSAWDDWQKGIASAEATYRRQTAAISGIEKKIQALALSVSAATSSGPLYDNLPSPLVVAISDADGNFAINLPQSGDYYVIAKFSRSFLGREETLRWVVPLSSDTAPKKLLLSNINALPN